jgi:hypothetical protein
MNEQVLNIDPLLLQCVERKRHVGNDVAITVFVEGGQPFDPSILVSHFIRILKIELKLIHFIIT